MTRLLAATVLSMTSLAVAQTGSNALRSIRVWSQPEVTRVVAETVEEVSFRHDRLTGPARVYFDLLGVRMELAAAPGKRFYALPVQDKLLVKVRVAESDRRATRLVFDLSDPAAVYTFTQLTNPNRLVVEFRAPEAPAASDTAAEAGALISSTSPTLPANSPSSTAMTPRISLEQMRREADRAARTGQVPAPPGASEAPARAVPDPSPSAVTAAATPPSARVPLITPPPALPARRPAQSMTRALGLKLGKIVLDPGHGGHDLGATSPSGIHEKDLVLDISRRLRQLLEGRLGAEVTLTRNEDIFLSLEQRTALANQERADLFLSIHFNSSPYPRAAGPETYFLNFNASRDALEVAARENASSGKTIFELQDLVKQIALNEKLTESRDLASRVQAALIDHANRSFGAKIRDRGVKRAPFVVLIGAAMPSILVELGFVTNPREESLLKRPEYRQALAEALYQGVFQYANTLSRFQVASRMVSVAPAGAEQGSR